ncbi:ATP synthase F1 subunit gamma [Candidatus Uhrbacteria bacterium RIFOXYB12_FULL_58_10]|uniref:ATP synthase gamma chain n=1 Tax=Candidatus Uhrbacteria bacterium RIFOXYB2_FULL_57_15 TaxID=1802422 RepID=A0A1F7W6C9_9BACT|nr:MAG: ATP synthase F1 subunit gamma [Candidatus Uhrbacteria bacterium RIFOXYB12_FULL_58_10]OGL98176.1 MAG: ATP synthase F1 subunit gamma [Candidatus Uhrbacteria bacterium RIFOXYB2_FULL_57_15]
MALQTRAIKRRIKSVKNTRKITKAMELVAGSKMRKAVSSVLGTRPYARLAWDTVLAIGSVTDTSAHPLLRRHEEVKDVLLILLTSDRGLAGGFNSNMIRKTIQAIHALGENVNISAITIGKRGADAMRRANKPILASFTDVTNNPRFEDVLPIGRMVVDEYAKGTYQKVVLAYTDFVSALTQKPIILDLLPLGEPKGTKEVGEVGQKNDVGKEVDHKTEYTFEPSPRAVLDKMLPRLVETMLYQAVLESAASEHSARMMAMRSASDAAEEMIDALTFTFNQARQAGITQEIAEISSGKAALENA